MSNFPKTREEIQDFLDYVTKNAGPSVPTSHMAEMLQMAVDVIEYLLVTENID